MLLGALRDSGRAITMSWWRLLLVQSLLAVVSGAALVAVSLAARIGATGVFAWISADPAASGDRVSATGFVLAALVVVIGLPVFLSGTAALIVLVDEALASGEPHLRSALGRGVRSTVRAVAAFVPAVAAVVTVFIAAPVVSLVGVAGLVISGVVFAARRRGRPQARWAWRAWAIVTVPFGLLWFVLPPAVLMVPAAVLDGAWPRAALARAVAASRGRRAVVLVVWGASVAVFVAGLFLAGTAASAGGSDLVSYVTAVVQLALAPLPVVAAAVLYRRAVGPRPASASARASAAPSLAAGPSTVMARVATATVFALLLPLGAVATGTAASAAPTPSASGVFVVNSDADTTDAAALAAQLDACTSGSGTCTFRAAVAAAESLARAGGTRATVRIDGARTIALSAVVRFEPESAPAPGGGGDDPGEETPGETPPTEQPPTEQPPTEQPPTEQPPTEQPPTEQPPTEQAPAEETPSETPAPQITPSEAPPVETPSETPAPLDERSSEQPQGLGVGMVVGAPASVSSHPLAATTDARGLLVIEGGGAILDGRGQTQILRVASEKWDLSVSDLTFRNGASGDYAGGLLAGVPQTTLTRTVFRGNSAPYGAGALFTRALTVDASAFLGNTATGWSESTWGGAIRAAGEVGIRNSTFSANSIGDSGGQARNQGSDVYADTAMTVVNSTFVDSAGGSLSSPHGVSTVRNSVFSVTDGITVGLACAGQFVFADNLHQQGDGSCVAGDTHARLPYKMLDPLNESGPVPFFPLRLTTDNGALGAGADCPSTDLRGAARPTQGCDLGAVQADGGSSLRVSATADEWTGGRATFHATVAGVAGAQPRGQVTFTIGDRTVGPLELTENTAPTEHGNDTAVAVVDDLAVGTALSWSASFTGAEGFRDSASDPQSLTLTPVGTGVQLSCATGNGQGVCTGTDWPVATGSTLKLDVTVTDPRAGTVVIASDAAGTTPLSDPVPATGRASFAIPASALPAGRTPLFAIFTSDDGRVRGVSPAGPAAVTRAVASVDLQLTSAEAIYGDATSARATVTVTSSGPTPTGTVYIPAVGTVTLDGAGRADVDLSSAPFGSTSFTAQYSGDGAYAPATSAAAGPFRFTPAGVSVRITGTEPASAIVGLPFTVKVEAEAVAPSTTVPPNGLVSLLVDGSPVDGAKVTYVGTAGALVSWTVVVPGDALAVGDHTLQALFTGSTGFTDAASATVSSSAGLAATTTTLVATPDQLAYSGTVSLSATVAVPGDARTPSGDVVFSHGDTVLGTVALAGCEKPAGCAQASLAVAASAIGVGDQSVTARYVGSGLFRPATTAPVAVTITPAAPSVQLGLPTSLGYGVGGDFTVRVADGATRPSSGAVVVTARSVDGRTVDLGTVALRDGEGIFTLDPRALAPGAYTVTAAFTGDARFTAASVDKALTIAPAQPVTAFDGYTSVVKTWGGSHTAGVTVSVPGQVGPEGDVVLTWHGQEVGRATLSAADDAGPGRRHVAVTATFDLTSDAIGSGYLTASFVGTGGFANAGPGGTWENPDVQNVRVEPAQAATRITSSVAYGENLSAEATVSVPGTSLVAEGAVTFTIRAPGRAEFSVTRSLRDGKAAVGGPDLGGLVVDSAGSWTVSAQYSGPPRDDRYVAQFPGNFAFVTQTLYPTGATVQVTDVPSTVQARGTLSVGVRVSGVTAAAGTVSLRRADRAADPGPEIALVNGRAQATLSVPAAWADTDQTFVVDYSGDGSLSSATSSSFTVHIAPTATSVVAQPFDLLAPVALVGSTTSFALHTRAASGPVPAGVVTLARGGLEFARGPIGADGAARLTTTVRAAADGPITATFTPLEAGYAPSTSVTYQEWAAAPVRLSVTPGSVTAGQWSPMTVSVAYDAARYPTLALDALPAGAPSGYVTLDAGAGNRCSVDLAADGSRPHASTGSCDLLFRTGGVSTVTASYSSMGLWESRTDSVPVIVTRGAPTLSLSAPDGPWIGLSTIPVTWEVRGPTVGTVAVMRGDEQVCESTVMSGSCSVTLPAFAPSDSAARLTLRYRGDAVSWDDASTTVQGAITACVPAPRSSVSPSGTATVTLLTESTCGGGSGYRVDTDVLVQVNTPDSSVIAGLSLDGQPVSGLATGGTAALATVRLAVRTIDGATPFASLLSVTTSANCIPVTVKTTGLSDALLARNILEWSPQSGCGGETRVADGWPVAMLRVGSDFAATLRTDRLPAHTQFLTWARDTSTGLEFPDGDAAQASTYGIRVTADTREIRGLFGPVCYPLPTVVQPSNGRIELTPPARNCGDPYTGSSGWLWGTTVTGKLTDATQGTRTFFDTWSGDTSRYTGTPQPSYGTLTHPLSFAVSDRPFTISATYASCVALQTKVIGETSSTGRAPGSVSVGTRSNCPAGEGTGLDRFNATSGQGERWYRAGTSVALTATRSTSAPANASFLGWGGVNVADSSQTTVTATLTGDTTAMAAFGNTAKCMPLRVDVVPAGSLNLDVQWGAGGNICDLPGTAPLSNTRYDQGEHGGDVDISATPATAAAQGADIVWAWSWRMPGQTTEDGFVDASSVWADYFGELRNDKQPLYGPATAIAYACNRVSVSASVKGPNGQVVTDAGASNSARAGDTTLSSFVGLPDADCSVGSDPQGGRAGSSWQVGTALLPVVTADPAAYRFTGWSGDVSGTGDTPDQPLVLGGVAQPQSALGFHHRIVANFQAICHRLTVGSDVNNVRIKTAPNCPGVAASENMFLGGTPVVVQGVDDGNRLFRGWSSGVDTISKDDARWATVTMTGDRTVTPNVTAKTGSETVAEWGNAVKDYAGVTSKKLVGFVSAGAVAFLKTLTAPISGVGAALSGIAEGFDYIGVRGSVLDGMRTAAATIEATLAMVYAPYECMTQWSSGGTSGMFYGIQNAVAGIAVSALSGNAKDTAKTVQTTQSKFRAAVDQAMKIKEQVSAAKERKEQAESVIDAARAAEASVANDTAGLDSTAAEAWGQKGGSLYGECMSRAMGAGLDALSGR